MPHAGESYEHSVRPEAFTLIELLVVISVIAVLMAILTPALSRARKLGQSAVCQAHLRQWGTVFFLYTADNSGRFWTEHNVWQTRVCGVCNCRPDRPVAARIATSVRRMGLAANAGPL